MVAPHNENPSMTELTIDQALQQGVEAHKAGHVQEADRLYTAILKAQPKHPDANHNMGVLAVGVGKVEQALPFFKTALEANPATAQFWLSYIDALVRLDKLAEAKAVLDQAKSKGAKGDGFDKLEQRLQEASEEPLAASKTAAKAPPPQPNILDSLKLDQAIMLAKKKAKDGPAEEAKRIYQDILTKFPKNKRARDGMKALLGGAIGNASKVQDPPQDQQQSLINLYSQGHLKQALEQANVLLRQFPSSSFLYNICGAANQVSGRLDAAIEAYKKALAIKPDYAEAYYNMGNALQDQSKLDEAIASYDKALAIKPDYAEAHYNMGVTLQEQGKLEEAIEAHNKALDIEPDHTEALYNMGILLKSATFTESNPSIQRIISSILNHKTYIRPSELAQCSVNLLKFEPSLQRVFEKHSDFNQKLLLNEAVLALSELPLLMKLMSVCPLADLELEAVITDIRSEILLCIFEIKVSLEVLRFQSALALQCFTNEYIYSQNDTETKALQTLEAEVEKTLSNEQQPNPQSILCLASYKALHNYEWVDLLTVTSDIEEVFKRQVLEPRQEIYLKSNIPTLDEITDKISSKVREQYEENPYPRWVNLVLPLKPPNISEVVKVLKLRLFDSTINDVEAPAILIAGCGTGLHSIEASARYKNSKVLAVDLSLSSLAYAKRKTEELGVLNIEYMQADILDLSKLNRQFNVIESAGVLHHMEQPMAGWKVLADCLKPGGLMRIGLYSELARQHVVKMREEIIKAGICSNAGAMRSFRNSVSNSGKEHHKQILQSNDFYTLSTLRDLLFHFQEHRFTVPQIKDCLSDLGLKFCGFEGAQIVQNFRLNHTEADDPYDLDKWQKYEEANPHTFAGMYQFWCQKLA